jgi:hypothetical protein
MNNLSYWVEKFPELRDNLEPLTLLMIRTAGEVMYFSKKNKTMNRQIVNSKEINILHSIDRDTSINKLKQRIKFLKDIKQDINLEIKNKSYLNLNTKLFDNSSMGSINEEVVAQINYSKNNHKYLTISGVGRIAAIQSVFPNGIPIKINVVTINYNLQKSLVAINNLYLYSNRFQNLKKMNITVNEIKYNRKPKTKKVYRRKNYIKSMNKKLRNFFIPLKG